MTAVVLLGPPGAGKGTVAEVLVEKGFSHISTGELLREQIRLKTPLGIEAKKRLDQGKFVSDSIALEMIQNLLDAADADQKFLFDGFPRTLVQAEKLDELTQSLDLTLLEVILLECAEEQLVKRLSGRQTCQSCGAVYHLDHKPPVISGVCDLDEGTLQFRADDNEETVRKRLKIYAARTAPLIDYYQRKGLIHAVDAALSIEQVRKAVAEELG